MTPQGSSSNLFYLKVVFFFKKYFQMAFTGKSGD